MGRDQRQGWLLAAAGVIEAGPAVAMTVEEYERALGVRYQPGSVPSAFARGSHNSDSC